MDRLPPVTQQVEPPPQPRASSMSAVAMRAENIAVTDSSWPAAGPYTRPRPIRPGPAGRRPGTGRRGRHDRARRGIDGRAGPCKRPRNFAPENAHRGTNPNLGQLIATHCTPVIKSDLRQMTPLLALQRYYAYAGEQLAAAGGHEPAASLALYGWARLQSALAASTRSAADCTIRGPSLCTRRR